MSFTPMNTLPKFSFHVSPTTMEFILLLSISFLKTHVWIADPAYGKDKLTKKEFLNRWNGIILVVEPTRDFQE